MPLLRRASGKHTGDRLIANPLRFITGSFLLIILAGTLLLTLPFASSSGTWTPLPDALFTATSATCVTGLIVYDTATYFSVFGQIVIIALIQIGGLGLATIAAFFFSFNARKRSWRAAVLARETTGSETTLTVWRNVRFVILLTFTVEALFAAYFIIKLWPIYGSAAIGKGLFHSVSAFCNAGFDLFGDGAAGPFISLATFYNQHVFLIATMFLIFAGGLGFPVWYEFLTLRKEKKLSFHSKVVLAATAFMILFGALLVFLLERDQGLATIVGDSAGVNATNAFFQSVTWRTAGFNVIDQAALSDSSKWLGVFFMFLGAAPAGTAGGIKLTTFIVVVSVVIGHVRGRDEARLSGRHIDRRLAYKAAAIFVLGLAMVILSTFCLSVIERGALQRGTFTSLDLLYEVASAFGTVGVTSIGTAKLHVLSRLILTVCMFLGRVGTVAFALTVVKRDAKDEQVLPEAKILIG